MLAVSAHRVERLAAAVQRGIQQVLARGLGDERIRGLITITEVKVLGDLSEAVVGVSVMPAEHADLTLHGLNAAAPHIRHELGDLVDTRALPRLRFKLDRSLKKQASLLSAIDQAKADADRREAERAAREAAAPPEAGAQP